MQLYKYLKFPLLYLAVLISTFLLYNCATSHFGAGTVTRSAVNVPDHFVVIEAGQKQMMQDTASNGCRNPVFDPRNDDRLQLVRSSENEGDYRVSPGKYGVKKNELLRINCTTGAPVGIVRE